MASLYWHVHHDVLFEPLTESLEVRQGVIREYKPKREQELRLRLLKPVRGPLSTGLDKALRAYFKAHDAYGKAHDAYGKMLETEGSQRADKVLLRAYNKSRDAFSKVRTSFGLEIDELHRQECPECPWDGTTLGLDKLAKIC